MIFCVPVTQHCGNSPGFAGIQAGIKYANEKYCQTSKGVDVANIQVDLTMRLLLDVKIQQSGKKSKKSQKIPKNP